MTIVNTTYDEINESKSPGKRWPFGENTDESFSYIDLLVMNKEEAIKISG